MARSKQKEKSRGAQLVERLQQGYRLVRQAPTPGARHLQVLEGVNQKCDFLEPPENVLSRLGDILVDSNRVFKHGNDIVMEVGPNDRRRLVPLARDGKCDGKAVAMLSNIVVCQLASEDSNKDVHFALPLRLIAISFSHAPTLDRLPNVECYARRPLFDQNFHWRGSGYHPDVQFLIHSDNFDPVLPAPHTGAGSIRDRLPPRLRDLLAEFCFRSVCDLVNAVGALLTGVLVNLFITQGKAVFVLDGNQPSVGKTLFARVIGMLLDNREPAPIEYSADESEIRKKAGATLMCDRPSVILFDNCKPRGGCIDSAFLEGITTSPIISERILGRSENYEQPNNVLFTLTMNNTRLGADMTARSCPIRFYYEGDPKARPLSHRDLISYVRQHRLELLAELAGMVVHWHQQGQAPGTAEHRLTYWAQTIGGILDANCLPGFLGNLDEANADFNVDVDELTSLAEAALGVSTLKNYYPTLVRFVESLSLDVAAEPTPGLGRPASELEPIFRTADVLTVKLAEAKGKKGQETVIGNFLSRLVNRSARVVEQSPPKRQGTAVLRTTSRSHSNQKVYYFDIRWDDHPETVAENASPAINVPPAEATVPNTIPHPPTGSGNQLEWGGP